MIECARERDKAFIDFVKTGNTKKVKAFAKKYGIPIPKDKRVFAGGIYKAVQYCTDISEDVKDLAFQKCLEIGMVPMIKEFEGMKESEDEDGKIH